MLMWSSLAFFFSSRIQIKKVGLRTSVLLFSQGHFHVSRYIHYSKKFKTWSFRLWHGKNNDYNKRCQIVVNYSCSCFGTFYVLREELFDSLVVPYPWIIVKQLEKVLRDRYLGDTRNTWFAMHRVHFYDQCKLHFGQGLDDDLRKITKVIRIYSLQMLLKGISFTCILELPL